MYFELLKNKNLSSIYLLVFFPSEQYVEKIEDNLKFEKPCGVQECENFMLSPCVDLCPDHVILTGCQMMNKMLYFKYRHSPAYAVF